MQLIDSIRLNPYIKESKLYQMELMCNRFDSIFIERRVTIVVKLIHNCCCLLAGMSDQLPTVHLESWSGPALSASSLRCPPGSTAPMLLSFSQLHSEQSSDAAAWQVVQVQQCTDSCDPSPRFGCPTIGHYSLSTAGTLNVLCRKVLAPFNVKKACNMLCGKGLVRTQDLGYQAERYAH